MLRQAGCKWIHLCGSFVTEKDYPEDYDACWTPEGVDISKLDRSFLARDSSGQKKKYLGEFYPSVDQVIDGPFYLEYFQHGKNGNDRGIIIIDLQETANKIYCGL